MCEKTKWFILNTLQVTACFAWTALIITFALIVLLLTFSQNKALMVAHHIWAPVIVWLSSAKLKITGLENIDFNHPHIFVMHHQSTLDIPIIFKIIPVPLRFIAKRELIFAPFVGLYVWAMGMIFIDRKNTEKAVRSLANAAEKIRRGASIIAYPEGTRSANGMILPFKKGVFVTAIQSEVPIVPIAIEGSRLVMPKNSFALRPHEVQIVIGEPISTKGLTQNDRVDLTEKVRNEVIRLHRTIGGKST